MDSDPASQGATPSRHAARLFAPVPRPVPRPAATDSDDEQADRDTVMDPADVAPPPPATSAPAAVRRLRRTLRRLARLPTDGQGNLLDAPRLLTAVPGLTPSPSVMALEALPTAPLLQMPARRGRGRGRGGDDEDEAGEAEERKRWREDVDALADCGDEDPERDLPAVGRQVWAHEGPMAFGLDLVHDTAYQTGPGHFPGRRRVPGQPRTYEYLLTVLIPVAGVGSVMEIVEAIRYRCVSDSLNQNADVPDINQNEHSSVMWYAHQLVLVEAMTRLLYLVEGTLSRTVQVLYADRHALKMPQVKALRVVTRFTARTPTSPNKAEMIMLLGDRKATTGERAAAVVAFLRQVRSPAQVATLMEVVRHLVVEHSGQLDRFALFSTSPDMLRALHNKAVRLEVATRLAQLLWGPGAWTSPKAPGFREVYLDGGRQTTYRCLGELAHEDPAVDHHHAVANGLFRWLRRSFTPAQLGGVAAMRPHELYETLVVLGSEGAGRELIDRAMTYTHSCEVATRLGVDPIQAQLDFYFPAFGVGASRRLYAAPLRYVSTEHLLEQDLVPCPPEDHEAVGTVLQEAFREVLVLDLERHPFADYATAFGSLFTVAPGTPWYVLYGRPHCLHHADSPATVVQALKMVLRAHDDGATGWWFGDALRQCMTDYCQRWERTAVTQGLPVGAGSPDRFYWSLSQIRGQVQRSLHSQINQLAPLLLQAHGLPSRDLPAVTRGLTDLCVPARYQVATQAVGAFVAVDADYFTCWAQALQEALSRHHHGATLEEVLHRRVLSPRLNQELARQVEVMTAGHLVAQRATCSRLAHDPETNGGTGKPTIFSAVNAAVHRLVRARRSMVPHDHLHRVEDLPAPCEQDISCDVWGASPVTLAYSGLDVSSVLAVEYQVMLQRYVNVSVNLDQMLYLCRMPLYRFADEASVFHVVLCGCTNSGKTSAMLISQDLVLPGSYTRRDGRTAKSLLTNALDKMWQVVGVHEVSGAEMGVVDANARAQAERKAGGLADSNSTSEVERQCLRALEDAQYVYETSRPVPEATRTTVGDRSFVRVAECTNMQTAFQFNTNIDMGAMGTAFGNRANLVALRPAPHDSGMHRDRAAMAPAIRLHQTVERFLFEHNDLVRRGVMPAPTAEVWSDFLNHVRVVMAQKSRGPITNIFGKTTTFPRNHNQARICETILKCGIPQEMLIRGFLRVRELACVLGLDKSYGRASTHLLAAYAAGAPALADAVHGLWPLASVWTWMENTLPRAPALRVGYGVARGLVEAWQHVVALSTQALHPDRDLTASAAAAPPTRHPSLTRARSTADVLHAMPQPAEVWQALRRSVATGTPCDLLTQLTELIDAAPDHAGLYWLVALGLQFVHRAGSLLCPGRWAPASPTRRPRTTTTAAAASSSSSGGGFLSMYDAAPSAPTSLFDAVTSSPPLSVDHPAADAKEPCRWVRAVDMPTALCLVLDVALDVLHEHRDHPLDHILRETPADVALFPHPREATGDVSGSSSAFAVSMFGAAGTRTYVHPQWAVQQLAQRAVQARGLETTLWARPVDLDAFVDRQHRPSTVALLRPRAEVPPLQARTPYDRQLEGHMITDTQAQPPAASPSPPPEAAAPPQPPRQGYRAPGFGAPGADETSRSAAPSGTPPVAWAAAKNAALSVLCGPHWVAGHGHQDGDLARVHQELLWPVAPPQPDDADAAPLAGTPAPMAYPVLALRLGASLHPTRSHHADLLHAAVRRHDRQPQSPRLSDVGVRCALPHVEDGDLAVFEYHPPEEAPRPCRRRMEAAQEAAAGASMDLRQNGHLGPRSRDWHQQYCTVRGRQAFDELHPALRVTAHAICARGARAYHQALCATCRAAGGQVSAACEAETRRLGEQLVEALREDDTLEEVRRRYSYQCEPRPRYPEGATRFVRRGVLMDTHAPGPVTLHVPEPAAAGSVAPSTGTSVRGPAGRGGIPNLSRPGPVAGVPSPRAGARRPRTEDPDDNDYVPSTAYSVDARARLQSQLDDSADDDEDSIGRSASPCRRTYRRRKVVIESEDEVESMVPEVRA